MKIRSTNRHSWPVAHVLASSWAGRVITGDVSVFERTRPVALHVANSGQQCRARRTRAVLIASAADVIGIAL